MVQRTIHDVLWFQNPLFTIEMFEGLLATLPLNNGQLNKSSTFGEKTENYGKTESVQRKVNIWTEDLWQETWTPFSINAAWSNECFQHFLFSFQISSIFSFSSYSIPLVVMWSVNIEQILPPRKSLKCLNFKKILWHVLWFTITVEWRQYTWHSKAGFNTESQDVILSF